MSDRNGLSAIRELADKFSDYYGKPATDIITNHEAREVMTVIDEKDATIYRLRRLVFESVPLAAHNDKWFESAFAEIVGVRE